MRLWLSEHGVAVRVFVLVLLFATSLTLLLAWRNSSRLAVFEALVWTGIVGLWEYFTARRRRRTALKLQARGEVLAYVRCPKSRLGSLRGSWDRGVLTRGPGKLEFQPAVNDTLEPSGSASTFTVLHASPEMRILSGHDSKYIGEFGFHTILVTTERESIEIAASPASL